MHDLTAASLAARARDHARAAAAEQAAARARDAQADFEWLRDEGRRLVLTLLDPAGDDPTVPPIVATRIPDDTTAVYLQAADLTFLAAADDAYAIRLHTVHPCVGCGKPQAGAQVRTLAQVGDALELADRVLCEACAEPGPPAVEDYRPAWRVLAADSAEHLTDQIDAAVADGYEPVDFAAGTLLAVLMVRHTCADNADAELADELARTAAGY